MRISRRNFVQGAAAAAAASGQARDAQAVTPAAGAHGYEFIPAWGKLPGRVRYGYTHGVAVDSQNRVLVHNRSRDAVILFDSDGRFIKSWGEDFEAGAHGMLLHKEGGEEFLYLADPERHLVAKTTLDGERLWVLRYPQECAAYQRPEQFQPTNVAVGPNGDIYVADGYGLSWIHQYNSRAEYMRSWGGKGAEAGKLDCPHGIWVDTRGPAPLLAVADRGNRRLQVFSLDGQHAGFVTGELRRPCHFDQRHGELLIPDLYGRVTIFDKDNRPAAHLGDNPGVWNTNGWPNIPREARETGKFIAPHAACWDREGNIYVVEWIADGRVTKLKRA